MADADRLDAADRLVRRLEHAFLEPLKFIETLPKSAGAKAKLKEIRKIADPPDVW
jgi:hypothetical protein